MTASLPSLVATDAGHEDVVLCDPDGRAVGVAHKARVHHGDTPLHLAFSCYLFDADGRLLLTRRALTKLTFPGVWTNSVCGHPLPGERLAAAVARRARYELGVGVVDVRLAIPGFAYEAEMGGVRERELCPVLTASCAGGSVVRPRPEEVDDHRWMPWPRFRDDVLSGRLEVSPWCREQVDVLATRPDDVSQWAGSATGALPDAAIW